MNKSIISVTNLKKTYKINKRTKGLPASIANMFVPKFEYKKAVDDISFEIQEGETVGFIGANGAGKSTTIKMLSGILYPDEGEIVIDGFIPYKNRKRYVSNIGVVFGQKSQLAWDLPVVDSYELLKHIYRISDDVYNKNLEEFTKLLDMEGFINQPVRQLSLGQRMRADIAAALLHSPKLVFFDEPTIGLDVVAKEKIREFIKYMNKEKGVTMIFTTHDMFDIQTTCKRIILIDKGKIIYDGEVERLLKLYGKQRKLLVEFSNDVNISQIKDVEICKCGLNKREFIFSNDKIKVKDLIKDLCYKYDIIDFSIKDMDVEHVVRQIYEGSIKLQ